MDIANIQRFVVLQRDDVNVPECEFFVAAVLKKDVVKMQRGKERIARYVRVSGNFENKRDAGEIEFRWNEYLKFKRAMETFEAIDIEQEKIARDLHGNDYVNTEALYRVYDAV